MCVTTPPPTGRSAAATIAYALQQHDVKKSMRKISLAEVEEHYMADDFWCVIDNKVYDLSNYDHPGGRIINLCPGTDCTVSFHQHHYVKGPAHQVLKRCQIGVLDLDNSPESPVMGEWFFRCGAKVAKELKNVPARPKKAVFLLFFDFLVNWALHYWSCCLTPDSPVWAVVLIPWLCECFSHRCTNHCHAAGHMQVVEDHWNKWLEIFLHASGVGTMPVHALPSEEGNLRHKINMRRYDSEREYWTHRGPYQHQALHHPRSNSFEDDGCFELATASRWFRLAGHQEPHWVHTLQKYEWYPFLIESGGIWSPYVYPIPFVLEAIYVNFKHGMPLKALANLLAIPWMMVALYAVVVSPVRNNLTAFVFLGLPLRFLMLTALKTFFMQHRFEVEEDESLPWGEAQLQACYQSDMSGPFLWISPIFWLCDGCKPSTSAFHLEHTLFPGICYLNLPRVAKCVDDVCREMGIPIDYKLQGWWALQKKHREIRLKFAPVYDGFRLVDPSPEKFKKNE